MYERTESSPWRVRRGILHNARLSPKTTIFLIIVKHIHDETHCSAALSCAVLLMISQPQGRFQGVNFWTEPLLTALTAKYFRTCKGEFFIFFCILSVFLFARFISFSLPESDPTKYAWLRPSPQRGPREWESFLLETVSNRSFLFQMLNQ